MSRQRTVTQIDAKARHLLAGFVGRGLLLRRGEGRGAYYVAAQEKRAVARSNGRRPVSAAESPDSGPSKARGGGWKKAGGEKRP